MFVFQINEEYRNSNHRYENAHSWQNTRVILSKREEKIFTEPSEHKRKYTSYAACPCSASKKYFHRVYLDILPLCTSTLIWTVVPCEEQQRAINLQPTWKQRLASFLSLWCKISEKFGRFGEHTFNVQNFQTRKYERKLTNLARNLRG